MLWRLIVFLIVFASQSYAVYMLDFRLNALEEKKMYDLNAYRGKIVFLLFFEEGCHWCKREFALFRQLQKEEEIHVIAVAMGKSSGALKKIAKGFLVLRASDELLAVVGDIEVTPYMLVANQDGDFATKIIGYQSKKRLQHLIQTLQKEKK